MPQLLQPLSTAAPGPSDLANARELTQVSRTGSRPETLAAQSMSRIRLDSCSPLDGSNVKTDLAMAQSFIC